MHNFDIPASKCRHGIKYVCARYGVDGKSVNESTIYRRMSAGAFPRPDCINGTNSWTGQVLDDYDAELNAKARESEVAA